MIQKLLEVIKDKVLQLGWNFSRINQTEKEEKKEVISIASAGKSNEHEENQFSNRFGYCFYQSYLDFQQLLLKYLPFFLLFLFDLSLRNNFTQVVKLYPWSPNEDSPEAPIPSVRFMIEFFALFVFVPQIPFFSLWLMILLSPI